MKHIKNYKTISTSNGDKGMSRNYSNEVLPKSDILFDVLGNIDELSSWLGLLYHKTSFKDEMRTIQMTLQTMNSLIATSDEDRRSKLVNVTNEDIKHIEHLEQQLLDKTKIEPVFVLPGSDTSLEGAYFDIARSVTRRIERSVVHFIKTYNRQDLLDSQRYVNRLSDLFFIFSRYCSK